MRKGRGAAVGVLLVITSACSSAHPEVTAEEARAVLLEAQAQFSAPMDQIHKAGDPYPRFMTEQQLRRLDVRLPPRVSIGSYAADPMTAKGPGPGYQMCFIHDAGYWLAAHSERRDSRSEGTGSACPQDHGATPVAD